VNKHLSLINHDLSMMFMCALSLINHDVYVCCNTHKNKLKKDRFCF